MWRELFDWTRRFDIRLLSLPQELQEIIHATSTGEKARPSEVVTSHVQLKEFLALPLNAKRMRIKNMLHDMGELAAALNCLDPAADIKLLKVENYFYHAESHNFLFLQKSPYPVESMMTLEQMVRQTSFPEIDSSLEERFKLAYKIAEAVYFIHTAGFLHKNITSSSVMALRRPH